MHKLEPQKFETRPALSAEEAQTRHDLARADLLLWIAVILGPFAAFSNTFCGFMVAHWVNQVGSKTTSFLICFFDLLLCISAGLLGLSLHRRFGNERDELPENGRRYFMATLAVTLSAFCVIVVLAQIVAMVILHPSD
jgi:hypothetical protein